MANQPMLPKSHTNSADLTSRVPHGRSTRDRSRVASYVQTRKRNALRIPALYPRPHWARLYGEIGKISVFK
ncbi:hypothetical protein EZMO1_4680 [Endozoicomonas montiporae CL-33]|uniref:Uncharacterized protein n=1 Tax=Endozoicomonas montiporae CL-33 TaxID=570277 RepID=A0A142BIK9_9GAMM|nr:hypothetical protein EZMO1_4680 [Endozoicomonas montiporae CL-33]